MKFTKGISGNPGGRPKAVAEVVELARAHTRTALDCIIVMMQNKKAPAAARLRAAEAILDRGWGKPPQSMNLMGNVDEEPMLNALIKKIRNEASKP